MAVAGSGGWWLVVVEFGVLSLGSGGGVGSDEALGLGGVGGWIALEDHEGGVEEGDDGDDVHDGGESEAGDERSGEERAEGKREAEGGVGDGVDGSVDADVA